MKLGLALKIDLKHTESKELGKGKFTVGQETMTLRAKVELPLILTHNTKPHDIQYIHASTRKNGRPLKSN